MVEMEMRVDDGIDARGIAVDGLQPGADFVTGGKPDLVDAAHSFAEPADRIVLTIWVQPTIEKDLSFRMLDQENRYRHGDTACGPFYDSTKLTFECTAGAFGLQTNGVVAAATLVSITVTCSSAWDVASTRPGRSICSIGGLINYPEANLGA